MAEGLHVKLVSHGQAGATETAFSDARTPFGTTTCAVARLFARRKPRQRSDAGLPFPLGAAFRG